MEFWESCLQCGYFKNFIDLIICFRMQSEASAFSNIHFTFGSLGTYSGLFWLSLWLDLIEIADYFLLIKSVDPRG